MPLLGQASIRSVNVNHRGESPPGVLPMHPKEVRAEVQPTLRGMGAENPSWGLATAYADLALDEWVTTGPTGARLGKTTVCSGVGVATADGTTVYRIERNNGRRPQNHAVYRHSGTRTVVGRIKTPGRMGGDFGWSNDDAIIAGSLASFRHNWVGVLLGYFDRPSLPYDGEWTLPNLVLAETRQPDQFHPDASFRYTIPPVPAMQTVVVVQAPTESTLTLDLRDGNHDSYARTETVTLAKGENQVVTNVVGPPSSGYVNVVPHDAPQGLTVTRATTQPPPIPA